MYVILKLEVFGSTVRRHNYDEVGPHGRVTAPNGKTKNLEFCDNIPL